MDGLMSTCPDRAAPLGTALVAAISAGTLDPSTAGARLLGLFLAGCSPHTLRAYRRDLEDFARIAGVPSGEQATAALLCAGPGAANERALAYRADLQARRLAPATVNRRLAALRSLVKLARTLGLVSWGLEVPGLRVEAYRDTRGPGPDGFRKLLARLNGRQDFAALRDRALLRLLYDLALRRGEVVGLDREDVDLVTGTVAVLGKGRREKVLLTLPGPKEWTPSVRAFFSYHYPRQAEDIW